MTITREIQYVLGMLVGNSVALHRVLVDGIESMASSPTLKETDVDCLNAILRSQPDRLRTVAEMLTARRRRKVSSLLPMTTQLLRHAFEESWSGYLGTSAAEVTVRPTADAMAYCSWLLRYRDWSGIERQLVRYELCRMDVADRVHEFEQQCDPGCGDSSSESCRWQTSKMVRVERFEAGIDEAVREFRRTGVVPVRSPGAEVMLVFYRRRGSGRGVAAVKVSNLVIRIIELASVGVSMQEMLAAISPTHRDDMRKNLTTLRDLGILETVAQAGS
jgi:hypothetical protein